MTLITMSKTLSARIIHDPASRARDFKRVVDQLKLAPVVLVACTSGVTEAASYVGQFGTQTLAGIVLVNGIAGREYDEATLSGLLSYANGFQLDRKKAQPGELKLREQRPGFFINADGEPHNAPDLAGAKSSPRM